MRQLPFHYAFRNLGRSRVRLAASLIGSTLVVLLILASGGFVRGMQLRLTALLVACGDSGSSGQGVTPVSWMSPSEPGEAIGVNHAKMHAKEGEAIVVRGRIGGRKDPLSPRSPVFTIIDMGLSACAGCGDSCSVPADTLRDNMATVQIVDAEGRPVTDNPIAAGLKAEDEVVIVGTVGASPGADTLMIMATSIHRVGN